MTDLVIRSLTAGEEHLFDLFPAPALVALSAAGRFGGGVALAGVDGLRGCLLRRGEEHDAVGLADQPEAAADIGDSAGGDVGGAEGYGGDFGGGDLGGDLGGGDLGGF